MKEDATKGKNLEAREKGWQNEASVWRGYAILCSGLGYWGFVLT